jgi:hypothetical protein
MDRTLGHRVFYGMKRCLVIASYLFVVFSLFDIHKSVILAKHQIDLLEFGLNLINALTLAKVVLVGQELHLADQLRDAPLIYPTLAKSFLYTVLLACFKILEAVAAGIYQGRSFTESVAAFPGGSMKGLLSLTVLLFVVLIPFFGFGELQRVFGRDRIVGVFLRPRHLVNLPQTGS